LQLAAATVATAYSAYEATRWGGVQATAFTEASANRTESAKARSDAFALIGIDANLFTQWGVAFTETIVFLGGLCGSARCQFTRPG
jgi:hypothetical protein